MIRKTMSTALATVAVFAALAHPSFAAEPTAQDPPVPPPPMGHSATAQVGPQPQLHTDEQRTLYALGLALAQDLDRLELGEPEVAYLVRGLEDGVLARPPQVNLEEYVPRVQVLAEQRMAAAAEREEAAAKEYLAKRASEPGAVRTESGIVVLARHEGTGARPTSTDTVRVNYEGKLPDGRVFDSTVQRGTPLTFPLDQVIPCWTEVVQTMKVGGRLQVVCPPELAYGSEGRPGIPPSSPLIFEIHLLGIGDVPNPAPGSETEGARDPLLQQIAAMYG